MGHAGVRKIIYISGTRADYGPARRLLLLINADPDIDLGILVTGMHLDPIHGETWKEIEADGLQICGKVAGREKGDTLAAMAVSTGSYLRGMARVLEEQQPDIVLLLGDRGEQLAGAMAAAFQNFTIAHLCGGAISGSIDDSIRHAITKFAHYHFPGFEEHATRILQMGEMPESVHTVGLPGGNLLPDAVVSRAEICEMYGIPSAKPYLLVVQHPVTHNHADASDQVLETLEALAVLTNPVLLGNPNDDAGGRVILSRMEEYADAHTHMQILPPPGNRELFASIMAHASALVGNSSAAVVEAMSVGLPVVNIGDRQHGREHLACWINTDYDRALIGEAIKKALSDSVYHEELEGYQKELQARDTEGMIVDHLKTLDLDAGKHPKCFHDLHTGSPEALVS